MKLFLTAASALLSGCATIAVSNLVGGNYLHHGGQLGTPHGLWGLLYLVSIPFDIATAPIQMFVIGAQL